MHVSYEVCERVVPFYGMQRDGSRFLHVLPEQHFAVRPVQVGHLNAGRPRVRPVQLVMDPVNGQSAYRRNKCLFACWENGFSNTTCLTCCYGEI